MTLEEQALELVEQELTVEHESAHAAAATLLGFDLTEVRADRPEANVRGRVLIRGGMTRPREFALLVLAGPLLDHSAATPRWPLLDDGDSDEGLLTEIVKRLDYGRADWRQLVSDAWQLVARDDFHRFQVGFTAALDIYPRLEGELLAAVIEALRRRNDQCSR
jgi:hypothetical protein